MGRRQRTGNISGHVTHLSASCSSFRDIYITRLRVLQCVAVCVCALLQCVTAIH